MAAIRRLWGTKHRLRILATILGVALIYLLPFLAMPGMAAIYLKLDGIDGESTSGGHEKWIDLESFQFGAGRTISSGVGGTRTPSAPSVSEIVVSKRMDRTSPLLFTEAVMGKARGATIHFTKTVDYGMESTYYELLLSDVLVSSFSQSSGGDLPSESVSLNFAKISMTYKQLDSKGGTIGTTSATFDVTAGTKY